MVAGCLSCGRSERSAFRIGNHDPAHVIALVVGIAVVRHSQCRFLEPRWRLQSKSKRAIALATSKEAPHFGHFVIPKR